MVRNYVPERGILVQDHTAQKQWSPVCPTPDPEFVNAPLCYSGGRHIFLGLDLGLDEATSFSSLIYTVSDSTKCSGPSPVILAITQEGGRGMTLLASLGFSPRAWLPAWADSGDPPVSSHILTPVSCSQSCLLAMSIPWAALRSYGLSPVSPPSPFVLRAQQPLV